MKHVHLYMLYRVGNNPWKSFKLGYVRGKRAENEKVRHFKAVAKRLGVQVKIYRVVETDRLIYTNAK